MGPKVNLSMQIIGMKLFRLEQIRDERGAVYHYLNNSDEGYRGFGEAYFSLINPGIVKGWKLHKNRHQNFCVPFGEIKLVVFDDRTNSVTRGVIEEIVLNDSDNYFLLSMPSGLWYSFKGIAEKTSLLANIIDHPHDNSESENLPLLNKIIPYSWL